MACEGVDCSHSTHFSSSLRRLYACHFHSARPLSISLCFCKEWVSFLGFWKFKLFFSCRTPKHHILFRNLVITLCLALLVALSAAFGIKQSMERGRDYYLQMFDDNWFQENEEYFLYACDIVSLKGHRKKGNGMCVIFGSFKRIGKDGFFIDKKLFFQQNFCVF